MAVRIEWETSPPAVMAKVLNDDKAWAFIAKGEPQAKHPSGVTLHRINGHDLGNTSGVPIEVRYREHSVCRGRLHLLNP